MCGIGGYYLSAQNVARLNVGAYLQNVQELQKHRGPDAQASWVEKSAGIGLCHNRLSIIDLSNNANQPMHSADGLITVIYNGEIYNWKDLRGELETVGVIFRTNSDTEVLIESYRKWGYDFFNKLRGMYAFAIFDHRTQELLLARDHIAKKPLVYTEAKNGFAFASEIPALLCWPEINKEIDHEAIGAMLLHNLRHIPEPRTIYKNIKKLRPGHALRVRDGKVITMWRHWTPLPRNIASPLDLREVLEDSVAIRATADVPVGALLSGGIDSTAIVNLMQRKIDKPVHTYAFGANKDDEDLRRARIVSKAIGTCHKEYYFDPVRQFEIFKQMLRTYGEPIMLLPLIHAYQLSEAIHNDGIKVVLNGNGADELFYGYTGHINTAKVTRLMNLFGWLRHLLPEFNQPAFSVFLAKPGKRKAKFYEKKAEECWPKIIRRDAISTLSNVVSGEMEMWGELIPSHDFIDESNFLSLLIENSHSLTIASDLPAMMASVEMRSPFLDQEIISAAMGIHFSKKVKGPKDGSQLKSILRKAVKDLVPDEVFFASKRGFGMGIQEKDVLLGPWRSYANEIFYSFPDFGIFERNKIQKLWEEACNTNVGQWELLAKLFAIGLWRNEVIK